MSTEPAPTTRPVRVVATGSRLLLGAVMAGALVAGALAGIPAALPGVHATAAHTVVTPDTGDTVLVCNGPFRALGRDASDALQMQSASQPRIQLGGLGEEPALEELDTPLLEGDSGVPVYTVPAEAPPADAAQSIRLSAPDLTGFAAGACRTPGMQAWIVGGAASVGTSDVLTLANPGEVPSRVTLTTYGAEGPSARDVIVPARAQIALPLAAAAIGASAPVVHVSAEGAPVHAALQSSLVRTLDPGGIDLQDTAGLPSTELVIAGVQVRSASQEELVRLRLLAPESATVAQVSIRLAGESGDAAEPQMVPLIGGAPAEIGFPGLAPGVYSIHVRAAAPLVGAVWQSTGSHPGSDFAWMTPAPEIEGQVVTAIPGGANARIHLVNTGDGERTVVVTDLADGVSREMSIPAGSSTLLSLRRAASFAVEADAGIHAAVAMYGADLLAGWPLWPAAGEATPVTVYP